MFERKLGARHEAPSMIVLLSDRWNAWQRVHLLSIQNTRPASCPTIS